VAKILIVDNNPANRDLLVRLPEYHGHSLREASDGGDALRDAIDLARDCGVDASSRSSLSQKHSSVPWTSASATVFRC
jgi:hypothetical protein